MMSEVAAHPAVFLDKDGTLVEDVPYNVDPYLIRLTAGAGPALASLQEAGFRLIVISNQSGVARGRFAETALPGVERRLRELLVPFGVELSAFYYCPHHPEGVVPEYAFACECRKPAPGMIVRAAHELALDLGRSWFIGDILDDVEAGQRAGCRTILVSDDPATFHPTSAERRPECRAACLNEAARYILTASAPP